jgi:hypothetical protein
MRIVAFRQVSEVPNHGGTDATEINRVHPKGLEELALVPCDVRPSRAIVLDDPTV